MINLVKQWLDKAFKTDGNPPSSCFASPEDVVYPGPAATLQDYVRFLLEAKEFVAGYPVPENRRNSNNQYSHARKPLIGDDPVRPAITNCSYEFFGRKLISIGYPLFVPDAPMIKNDDINPAFNNGTLWDSFEKVLHHYAGDLGSGETKYGYQRATHHAYIERPVPEETFDHAQKLIEFYTRTPITDPKQFIDALDKIMRSPTPDASPTFAS